MRITLIAPTWELYANGNAKFPETAEYTRIH